MDHILSVESRSLKSCVSLGAEKGVRLKWQFMVHKNLKK